MTVQWYVVTGRISGWDEDTTRIIRAENTQNAMQNFKDQLLTEKFHSEDYDPDGAPDVYVNSVVSCGKSRPTMEYAV